jgi:alkylation response protein AidB-like acyl-CoA dehydrogenase
MKRRILTQDHEHFFATVKSFFESEAVPNLEAWESAGLVDRDFYRKAGALGLLGFQVPEEYGGAGLDTYTYNVVVSEAAASVHFAPTGLRLHTDVVLPYFLKFTDDDQKARWLPDLASGDLMAAIAMSEPGSGSDLAGISTKARRDGDSYVISGAKTFITSGLNADLVIVVARTDVSSNRRDGLTLLVVEDGMKGFSRGRKLNKLGLKYSDTAELFFDDVHVPVANRLGDEGQAFRYLASNLPQERLSISVGAVAMATTALNDTIEYARNRKIFEQPLSSFQNTKFVLAEVATEIEAAQQFLDRAVEELDDGELSPADAAKVKLFCTEMQARAVDRCLQVYGGYGYVHDYPIATMYADARVTRIYGGSSEVMKVIIAKSLGI